MRTILLATAVAGVLYGCGTASKLPPVAGLTAEEATERLEESKREYETCVKNREPGRPTCDSLEDLYERDKQAYESVVR